MQTWASWKIIWLETRQLRHWWLTLQLVARVEFVSVYMLVEILQSISLYRGQRCWYLSMDRWNRRDPKPRAYRLLLALVTCQRCSLSRLSGCQALCNRLLKIHFAFTVASLWDYSWYGKRYNAEVEYKYDMKSKSLTWQKSALVMA